MNEKEKGVESKRLLENPLIKEFFEDTEKALFNQWKQGKLDNVEIMKINIAHLNYLQMFKTRLENYAEEWKRKQKEEKRHKYYDDNNPLI